MPTVVFLAGERLDGDGERVGNRWKQRDRHTVGADLVRRDHPLGAHQGIGELELSETVGFCKHSVLDIEFGIQPDSLRATEDKGSATRDLIVVAAATSRYVETCSKKYLAR